jgi:hypothetical protein
MPAIIFADGFDTYTTILDEWDALSVAGAASTVTIIPGLGRGGAGAFQSIASHSAAANVFSFIRKNVGAQTTLYIGFAFNWGVSSQNADSMIAAFADGGTIQLALWIKSSGTMYITRGGSPTTNVLGTVSSAYPSNSYHYVEMKVTIDSAVGVAQLKVDQSTVLNLTGQNTKVTSNSSFDSVFLGNNFGGSGQFGYIGLFDDVYFDTSGFNGDVRIAGLLPTGNGTTQNFSNVEASWAASTVTNLQTTIFDGTNLQRATAITGDFKTGTSAPTWNVTLGATTTDNQSWVCVSIQTGQRDRS